MAVLVQNENMKNQTLNFKGTQYQCDEKGVMRCSPLVAEFLLKNNPGNHWKKYKRNLAQDEDALKMDILQAEADFRAAERKLNVAKQKLVDFKKDAEQATKLDAEEVSDPIGVPLVVTPEVEVAAEISEEDYPTMAWQKSRIVDFAVKHGIEVDSADTKADILAAIEEATE